MIKIVSRDFFNLILRQWTIEWILWNNCYSLILELFDDIYFKSRNRPTQSQVSHLLLLLFFSHTNNPLYHTPSNWKSITIRRISSQTEVLPDAVPPHTPMMKGLFLFFIAASNMLTLSGREDDNLLGESMFDSVLKGGRMGSLSWTIRNGNCFSCAMQLPSLGSFWVIISPIFSPTFFGPNPFVSWPIVDQVFCADPSLELLESWAVSTTFRMFRFLHFICFSCLNKYISF